jgi:hypothetical protein
MKCRFTIITMERDIGSLRNEKGGKEMRWVNVIGKMMMTKESKAPEGKPVSVRTNRSGFNIRMDWLVNQRDSDKRSYYSEKRMFQRYADGREAVCYPMTSLPIKAMVLDASLGGLRIKSQGMLRISTDVGVVLNIKGKTAHFLVKILWEAERNGDFEYGLEFVKDRANNNRHVVEYIAQLKS